MGWLLWLWPRKQTVCLYCTDSSVFDCEPKSAIALSVISRASARGHLQRIHMSSVDAGQSGDFWWGKGLQRVCMLQCVFMYVCVWACIQGLCFWIFFSCFACLKSRHVLCSGASYSVKNMIPYFTPLIQQHLGPITSSAVYPSLQGIFR